MRKKNSFLLSVLMFILGLKQLATAAASLPSMSVKQLASFDGQAGHRAYVALNGYVYDVSKLPQWQDGQHYRGMHAGSDVTPFINSSPHASQIIAGLALAPLARLVK